MAAIRLMDIVLRSPSRRGEDCPVAFEEWEMERIPELKSNALDRLVAAGTMREIDRNASRSLC